jgi:hypothetical protein
MALMTDVTIDNIQNSKRFIFRGTGQWSFKKSQPAISIPIADAQPQNNVLFRFTGQTEEITFSFVLVDDGSDCAAATHTSTVVTIDEQIAYLRATIYTEEFDTYWTLYQTQFFPGSGVNGVITDLTIEAEGGNPNMRRGSLTFMRGRVGSL